MKSWDGNPLSGKWEVTWKLDGVRAIIDANGVALSRAGKPLYNLQHLPAGDYEIFHKNWETSVSLVRTKQGTPVNPAFAFSLHPLDVRLDAGVLLDPSSAEISSALADAISRGHEGLVLRNGGVWIKVKTIETHDVVVTGVIDGKGKYIGGMGALITDKGKVGTGFTKGQRFSFGKDIIGQVIEVECMSLTPAGKFRQPRFVRIRFDK